MRLAQIIGMMGKEGEIIVDLSEVKLLVLYSIHKRPPFFSLFFVFFHSENLTSATSGVK